MENPKDVFAKERFYTHLHSEEEIRRISEALKYNKEIELNAEKVNKLNMDQEELGYPSPIVLHLNLHSLVFHLLLNQFF